MQYRISNVAITGPCSQQWGNMLPDAQGKYCLHCQKAVTDFTIKSNAEIISLLSEAGSLCGRFNQVQLQSLNRQLALNQQHSFSWKKLSLAAAFASLLPFVKAEAKVRPPVEQGLVNINKLSSADSAINIKVLRGIVTDSLDNSPLAGVTVMVKGTTLGTVTNTEGSFIISVPDTGHHILQVMFIGYVSKNIVLSYNKTDVFTIKLKQVQGLLTGEVLIVRRQSFFRRTWYQTNKAFKSIFR